MRSAIYFEFDCWVTTDASGGSQNPRIWQGNDAPAARRQYRASHEAKSTTWYGLHGQVPSPVALSRKREGNGGAPMG